MTRDTDKVDQNRNKGGADRPAKQVPERNVEKRDKPDIPARPPQKPNPRSRNW